MCQIKSQAVKLPTPIDPKKMKRDKERPKVIEELLKEYMNPSFRDTNEGFMKTIFELSGYSWGEFKNACCVIIVYNFMVELKKLWFLKHTSPAANPA